MKAILSFLFIILFSVFSLTFGQTTYDFLRVDMSARAAALGGSFVSNNDDVDVIFYNPAGMNFLEKNPASFSFVKHLLDINLFSVAFSTEFENIGRFGTAVKYINYGTFDQADEFGNRTGEFGAGELAFLVGYANEFSPNFYYGANAKFIYSSIADKSSSAVGADLGINYEFPAQQLNLAAAVLNLGTQISSYINTKEDLPLDVVIGVSKRLERVPVRLSLDFHQLNKKRDDALQHLKGFSVGAEFYLSEVFTLRFGYDNERRSDLKVGSSAGIAGFNGGLGVKVSEYQFSYGYSSLGLVGAMHRIGVSTSL
ncbi:MAG: type IX secretion system protein PorQ [Ignavibacteriaceae bacterium]|nr:type IX secretion system protein PorQ [Ignavibacteriaceae bacterium]MCW8812387.1 type IX secretion system protein PorQ [Chlorobium sp.]MCW8962106.1 type IX secretion system protein PorQ [Ignavibacteriaceae bacterium]MCW9095367.1 type IX secretion system protein PorQ [Ignavibacteriaceae bacterium]MCW9096242.1 type IX secretion system protein PorQ [Ignavibacteriaceae bacterium]